MSSAPNRTTIAATAATTLNAVCVGNVPGSIGFANLSGGTFTAITPQAGLAGVFVGWANVPLVQNTVASPNRALIACYHCGLAGGNDCANSIRL